MSVVPRSKPVFSWEAPHNNPVPSSRYSHTVSFTNSNQFSQYNEPCGRHCRDRTVHWVANCRLQYTGQQMYLVTYSTIQYTSRDTIHYVTSTCFGSWLPTSEGLRKHKVTNLTLHYLKWNAGLAKISFRRFPEDGSPLSKHVEVPLTMNCFSWCVLYCTVLYYIVLYCSVLYCVVFYCAVLYYIVLYCSALYCVVLYCTVLYYIVLYCSVLCCVVLYCTVLYCIILHYIVFIVLYYTVLYCTYAVKCICCPMYWCT